jgi:hypothetical protein
MAYLSPRHIDAYLEYKKVQWAPSTMKSEVARLNAAKPLLAKASKAEDILEEVLSKYKAYTAKIVLTRLADYESWVLSEGLQPGGPARVTLADLLRRCYRRFQGSYRKERLRIDYQTAAQRLAQISDPEVRRHAQAILYTGMRAHESMTVDTDRKTVVGKGGLQRRIYNLDVAEPVVGMTYTRLYKGLKKVGLKPHSLRKLAATHFAKVLTPQDLMSVMGWSNMNTAMIYLQEAGQDEMEETLKRRISCV